MSKSLPLEELVSAYLDERTVFIQEKMLDELVERTTSENLDRIVSLLQTAPNSHEVELSLYISEVARPDLQGLAPIIQSLRQQFTDKDALEELDTAENILGLNTS